MLRNMTLAPCKRFALAACLAACLAAIGLAACAQSPALPESRRLADELAALIGPAACTADPQCRTVAVGAKACGGPSGFLAWSTQNTDPNRVAELAARQSRASRLEIEASGLRSNCAVVPDPGARCVSGQCRLSTPVPTP